MYMWTGHYILLMINGRLEADINKSVGFISVCYLSLPTTYLMSPEYALFATQIMPFKYRLYHEVFADNLHHILVVIVMIQYTHMVQLL